MTPSLAGVVKTSALRHPFWQYLPSGQTLSRWVLLQIRVRELLRRCHLTSQESLGHTRTRLDNDPSMATMDSEQDDFSILTKRVESTKHIMEWREITVPLLA